MSYYSKMITEAFQVILKYVAPGQEDIVIQNVYKKLSLNTSIDCDECWMSESGKKHTVLNHLMIYCNPSDSGNNYWIPHKVLFID
jgi:hypothetical protein